MALTQINQTPQQVYSGMTPPTNPPSDTSLPGIYVLMSAAGAFQGVYYWDDAAAQWVAGPSGDLNWSQLPEFGWVGRHNETRRPAQPAHTPLYGANAMVVLHFSADEVSASPVEFRVYDRLTDATLATGTMPAGSKFADAAGVGLVDATGTPITSLQVVQMTPVQLACVPLNGHAAAPSTGAGFSVGGMLMYA